MIEYIITIVPVVDDEAAGPISQTIVRVDTEGGRPYVKELTMRGPEGARLDTRHLPRVDFEMLLRAFMPGETVPAEDGRPAEAASTTQPEARPTPPRRARTRPASVADKDAAAWRPGKSAGKVSAIQKGRAYRRMPDPAALEAAYAKTGTIAGVAAHFEVPVHTAQGWISRLRRKNEFSTEGS
jgi:hypothetical protein